MPGKRVEDLTGRKFGMLTPLKIQERKSYPCGTTEVMWFCRCDCGNTTIVSRGHLKKGTVKSCGCSKKYSQEKLKKPDTYKKLKKVWNAMKRRCYCKNDRAYRLYGERGIEVCDKWLKDFQSFYDWAISHGYQKGLSIDRINNDGNYEPDNCQWASCKEQNNNRRCNKTLELNGEKHTIAEWAIITGIKSSTLSRRIKKGLPPEKVLGF